MTTNSVFALLVRITIRTNGGKLTVNASNDTVNHYAMLNEVAISDVASTDCYHEYGTVKGQLNITKGKVVLESKANVGFVNVTATSASDIALEVKSGADFGRLTCKDETILASVATSANIPASKQMKTVEGTVAIVANNPYTSLDEAMSAFTVSGSLFELFTDINNEDMSSRKTIILPENGELDGNGYVLSGNVTVDAPKGGKIHDVFFKNIHNNSVRDKAQVERYGIQLVGTLSCIYCGQLDGTIEIYNCNFDNADWDMIQISTGLKDGSTINIHNNVFNTSKPEIFGQIRWIHIQSKTNVDFAVSIKDNDFYDAKNLLSKDGQAVEIYYPVDASKVEISGNYFDGVKSASDVSKSDLDMYYACIGTGGTSYNNANEMVFNGLRSTPNNK